MASVDIKTIIPQVLPECLGCPNQVIINAARNVMRDFCKRSTYLRADHALISTVTDESSTGEYTLTEPTNYNIVSVAPPIMHNSLPVYLKTVDWLNRNEANWATRTGQQIKYVLKKSNLILRAIPYPTTADTDDLLVRLVLQPTSSSTVIDADLYNEWYEPLAAGVKGKLMIMPEKEWTDLKLGAAYLTEFEDGVDAAYAKAIAAYQDTNVDRNHKSKAHFF